MRDFSKIISNLRPRAKDIGPDKKLMERILTKSSRFKDDANDKARPFIIPFGKKV